MSDSVLTIEDAARRLPEVVDRVHTSGEVATLTKSGSPVARIVPISENSKNGTSELIVFLRKWRVDHPEPDDQFAEAMEESRKTVRPQSDPWQ